MSKPKTIKRICLQVILFVFYLLRFCLLSTVTLLGLYALIIYLIPGWEFDSTLTALFLLYMIFLILLNAVICLLIYLTNISKAIFEKYWMAIVEPMVLICLIIISQMIVSLFINEQIGATWTVLLMLVPSYIMIIALLWLLEHKWRKINSENSGN